MTAKVLLALFGVVALFMGSVFGWIGWSSRQSHVRLASLGPLDLDLDLDLDQQDANIGRPGYLEGRLAERNPPLAHGLVLYTQSVLSSLRQERGGVLDHPRRVPQWRTVERTWPSLWLTVEGDEIQLVGDYQVMFRGDDPVLRTGGDALEVGVTERFEGWHAGQAVTAVGAIGADGVGRFFEVETLSSGSFADLQHDNRSGAAFGWMAGAALLLVGVVLLGLAVAI